MTRESWQRVAVVVITMAQGTGLTACQTAGATNPSGRCPLPMMRGSCAQMTMGQKSQLREALQVYVLTDSSDCRRARDALQHWVAEFGPSWVFGSARSDNHEPGSFVLGMTAFYGETTIPAGVAFRKSLFAMEPVELARVALHEAAHMTGYQEADARALEARCIRSDADALRNST
jgi:hypothetical protein